MGQREEDTVRMTLSLRLSMGFFSLLLIVVVSGAAGLYGSASLSGLLAYLTGPAWNTADGAMEGTIGVEAEMLAIERMMVHGATPALEKMFSEAQASADEALGRMVDAGLMSDEEVQKLSTERTRFATTTQRLLDANERYRAMRAEAEKQFYQFQMLMIQAEALGDSAVEVMESAPDELQSWNGGLS